MVVLNTPKLYLALIICLLTYKSCESENILIFVLVCSYSQLNVLHPYGQKLLEAGHNVTMIMPTEYKTPHPKINYWIPKELRQEFDKIVEIYEGVVQDRIQSNTSPRNPDLGNLPAYGIHLCKMFLESQDFWGKLEDSKFDLVIIDDMFNHCGLGFAYKFQAPFLYFATSPLHPTNYDTFGVDPANSWVPDMRARWIGNEMNFYQRVQNVLSTLEMHFGYRHVSGYLNDLDELLRTKLNMPDMPYVAEIEKNTSLIFLNSHFILEVPRALPPMFVEVGGLQCSKKEKFKLPENINNFIQKFPKGFVYISFGTLVQLPDYLKEMFLQAFSKFPTVGFIMKWTGNPPDKIPPNLMTLSYAPQQPILAHKDILCFVSHGGMLGTQEAVYHGVPIIGVPFFADQDFNVNNLMRRGAALKLEISLLTLTDLENAVAELINNSSYLKAMKRISKLSKDRPQQPMDSALWWTEYVMRNSKDGTGLDHLKSFGINQYWFQRRCLDVWGFILLAVLIIIYTAIKIASWVISSVLNFIHFGKRKVD